LLDVCWKFAGRLLDRVNTLYGIQGRGGQRGIL